MDTRHGHGELIYEYTATLTGMTEYGASLQALLEGTATPPPGGLRVDICFEGPVHGRMNGYLRGIDYLTIRSDGRMDLDLRGSIETPDGARIAFAGGGVVLPEPGTPISRLREHVKLSTAHPDYAWVNTLEFWAVGEADLATREVRLRGYLPA